MTDAPRFPFAVRGYGVIRNARDWEAFQDNYVRMMEAFVGMKAKIEELSAEVDAYKHPPEPDLEEEPHSWEWPYSDSFEEPITDSFEEVDE